MKNIILTKLNQIKAVAEQTGMEGKLSLRFERTTTMLEFDNAIESITEFPRYSFNFQVTNNLTVAVLLD